MSEIKDILDSYDQTGIINPADGVHYPPKRLLSNILDSIQELLFPGFFGVDVLTESDLPDVTAERVRVLTAILESEVYKCLFWDPSSQENNGALSEKEARSQSQNFTLLFIKYIPELRRKLKLDAVALYEGDPAASSLVEVILSYPGFLAVMGYRIAHFFYNHSIPLIPRMFTEIVHQKTGIDIHPGAQIGHSFCMDHGTGIVIGETAVLGNYVKLYQGVTLGAFSVQKGENSGQRHPTLKDHVTVYAMSTILGGNTVVGAHSIVGGNVWLTRSIADYSKIYLSEDVESTYRYVEGRGDNDDGSR